MTQKKEKIIGIDPGKLKAGDIVLRSQRIGVNGGAHHKPAAKFLILGRAKTFPKQSNINYSYFDAYLLWCDENYLGYHNKVGDIWQIPWYAFRDEGRYQMEFECDKSTSVTKQPSILTKQPSILTNQREKQSEV